MLFETRWTRIPAHRAPSLLPQSTTCRSRAIMRSSFRATALKDTSFKRSRISEAERGTPSRSIGFIGTENGILRLALPDERRDRGIARIAAVPVGFAVDLDGLEHRGQTSRGEQNLRCNSVVPEDPTASGPNIGRSDEEFDRRLRQALEIDQIGQDLVQWIGTPRIQVVGRKQAGYEIRPR